MSENEEVTDDDELFEDPVVDVADRLIRLMRRIEKEAGEITFEQPHQTLTGLQKPLHEVFEPLALGLDFDNYAQLRDNFVALCKRVKRDIESLSVRRESTKERWIQAADTANGVFNASNFGRSCDSVFDVHFSDEVYERLEDASERLQDVGRQEATSDQLKEALDSARKIMNVYEKNGNIPSDLNRILKHYLQQIELAYQRYNDFGEQVFWTTYKEYFATFLQVHPVIMPSDASDATKKAVNDAMRDMSEKMFYGLSALSVTADVATLATTGFAMLTLTGSL